jgi:hypothetical protein
MDSEGRGSLLGLPFRPNMNTRGRNRVRRGSASNSQETASLYEHPIRSPKWPHSQYSMSCLFFVCSYWRPTQQNPTCRRYRCVESLPILDRHPGNCASSVSPWLIGPNIRVDAYQSKGNIVNDTALSAHFSLSWLRFLLQLGCKAANPTCSEIDGLTAHLFDVLVDLRLLFPFSCNQPQQLAQCKDAQQVHYHQGSQEGGQLHPIPRVQAQKAVGGLGQGQTLRSEDNPGRLRLHKSGGDYQECNKKAMDSRDRK